MTEPLELPGMFPVIPAELGIDPLLAALLQAAAFLDLGEDDVVDPDGRLSHDQPFDRGQGQMRLAPGTDGRPFISHFDGHTLFLSRQGIALHDRLIFGPAALR